MSCYFFVFLTCFLLQHASSLKACCSKEVRLPKAGARIRNDSGLLAVIKWEQLAKLVVLVLGTVPYGEGRELVHMLGPELCIVSLVVEPADAPCTAIPRNRRTFKKSHEDLLPLLNNPRNPIAIFRPSNFKTISPHTVYSTKNSATFRRRVPICSQNWEFYGASYISEFLL
jgi:hypothetical protein